MKNLVILFFPIVLFACGQSTNSSSGNESADSLSSDAATDTVSNGDVPQTKTLKLKAGKEVSATLATDSEIEQVKNVIEAQGISLAECCGQEACINGYIWSCSRGNDNKCHWYKSDWKCNSN